MVPLAQQGLCGSAGGHASKSSLAEEPKQGSTHARDEGHRCRRCDLRHLRLAPHRRRVKGLGWLLAVRTPMDTVPPVPELHRSTCRQKHELQQLRFWPQLSQCSPSAEGRRQQELGTSEDLLVIKQWAEEKATRSKKRSSGRRNAAVLCNAPSTTP